MQCATAISAAAPHGSPWARSRPTCSVSDTTVRWSGSGGGGSRISPTMASTATPALRRSRAHAADHLSGERLRVEEAFAGDDQIDPVEVFVEVELLGHQLESRHQLGAHRRQPAGQPSGGTRPGQGLHVDPGVRPVDLGQAFETPREQLHLSRSRTLLRPEDLCRLHERRGHIAAHEQLHAFQPLRRVQRVKGAETPVGGRRSAHPHEHAGGTRFHGEADQLARAERGGFDRVVAVGPAGEFEPRCLRHLDDGHSFVQSPPRLDRLASRSPDSGRAVRAAERIEEPLAAVGQRQRGGVVPRGAQGVGDGEGHGARRRRAPELVGRHQDSHRPMMVRSGGAGRPGEARWSWR